MSQTAPIALFAFNRPRHLATTLETLAQNELAGESLLTIFCDGARSAKDDDGVAAVRSVAHEATGFRSVRVVERPENFGLARSIITGVSEMLAAHERVIVVEDDLTTSPHFLRFMNDGLERYAGEDRVASVCGYRHPIGGGDDRTYFLRGAFCWGWGTWSRAWRLFEHDAYKCLTELDQRNLIYDFDFLGSMPYTQFLLASALGKGDSWAMRWMASTMIHDKLTLYPGQSLVRNAGNDSSGTHAGSGSKFDSPLATGSIRVGGAPVRADEDVLEAYRRFHLRAQIGWSGQRRLFQRVATFLPRGVERRAYTALVRRSLRRAGSP